MNVVVVCSRNKWRSPTAERLFADYPGVVCASAGLTKDADRPLTDELVAWAEVIFVMEPEHRTKLMSALADGSRIPGRFVSISPTGISSWMSSDDTLDETRLFETVKCSAMVTEGAGWRVPYRPLVAIAS